MLLSIRAAVITAALLAALTLVVQGAFAKDQGGTRPGWGHGDDNHTHTGPPGQTRQPDQDGTRPGNGNGDQNHTHTGPPGQNP